MTAQRLTNMEAPASDLPEDLLLTSSDPLEAARRHVAEAALTDGPGGRVGLELEFHLVDLAHPAQRPTWAQALELAEGIGPLPHHSPVTLEPGGQIELSTPPGDDVV
ncbi:MAG: glutamate-cysteine ligase family protein, partial [Marmoricola sp.]